MSWISPTGHNDPDGFWIDDVNAYDDDTGTYAYIPGQNYLELIYAKLMSWQKQIIRLNSSCCDRFNTTN